MKQMLSLSVLLNNILENLATAIREEKEISGIQICKENDNLTLCSDGTTTHTRKLKRIKYNQQTGKECSKVSSQLTQKIAFLYINNGRVKYREKMITYIHINNINHHHHWVCLTRYVLNLYEKPNKSMMHYMPDITQLIDSNILQDVVGKTISLIRSYIIIILPK